jgi:hypothetical protein
LMMLVGCQGLTFGAIMTTMGAAVPRIVPVELLPAANSLGHLVRYAGSILGPVLAISGGRRSTRENRPDARVGRVGGWGTPSYGRRRTPRRDRRWYGGECLAPAVQVRCWALSRAACRVRWSRSGRLGADRAASA